MNYKPRESATLVMLGIIFGWIVGPLILAFSIPQTFVRYGSSSAGAFVFLGVIVELLGIVCLMVGVGRALGTLDYLGHKAAAESTLA